MASDKQVGIKVIGAGLPRTSTTSLQHALIILGFGPCYHVESHILSNITVQCPAWVRIANETNKEKRKSLIRAQYEKPVHGPPVNAAVDAPTCFLVDDVLEMYPDAKVILGIRDSAEVWHKSVMATVGQSLGKGLLYYLGWWSPEWVGMFKLNNGFNEMLSRRFGIEFQNVEIYDAHNAWVKEVVPKDKLLVFNAKEGWEPLCNFLGVPVPNQPYPRENDSGRFKRVAQGYLTSSLIRWALLGAALASSIALMYRSI